MLQEQLTGVKVYKVGYQAKKLVYVVRHPAKHLQGCGWAVENQDESEAKGQIRALKEEGRPQP